MPEKQSIPTRRKGTAPSTPIRILIVDDHPVMRVGLSRLIAGNPDMEVCGEAASAARALELAESLQPDLAVVDVSLPDLTGLELCKLIRQNLPECRVVMCSMHEDALYAERALRAGASGYVNKSEDGDHLLSAIRNVARGAVHVSEEVANRVLEGVASGGSTIQGSRVQALSNRELEVFELIGQGKSSREIADMLSLSVKTVDAHRQRIKTKLNLKSGNELVYRAIQWVMEEEGPQTNDS